MNLFLKTLYMLTVMVMTGIMMVIVLLCTPEFHTKLSGGFYQQSDMSYSQFVLQSLDNPGIYLAQVPEEEEDSPRSRAVKKEAAWDYYGNNTGYLKILIDYSRPQHDPWPSAVECMGLRVSFARRRTLPRTALASFPGSGNTWFRYLIQSTSGLFTGSIYNDRQLAKKGFYGESDPLECGCTIVVKTHGYTLGVVPKSRDKRSKIVEKFYGRGILLLRNPYDTLIAFRNYQYGGHLGIASPLAFHGQDWARFVQSKVEKWGAFANDWITGARNLHVVHFENMQVNPKQELLKIMQFLHLRVDPHRLKCVLANLNGSFRRITPENTFYRKKDPFTPELHASVEKHIGEVNDALVQRGWSPLPTHLYNYHVEIEDPLNSPQNNAEEEQETRDVTPKVSNISRNSKISKAVNDGSGKRKVFPAIARSARAENSIRAGTEKRDVNAKPAGEKVYKLYPWMKS
ncbi:sialate:O-sulfotransferase 2-like isoform X2 [Palaemon carinicauda]|uniref:sialate:O-sulfotransferase 2-like isoform X2 n=1 Tax=Palaemon carinicauda TaxID=392227 RepID=UPI0035B6606B